MSAYYENQVTEGFVLLGMATGFLPVISAAQWEHFLREGKEQESFDLITQPLHEALYQRQSFDFLEELNPLQQMLIAYDYIHTQVAQGGFLQLIQNRYVSLILPVIEGLMELGQSEAANVLDDVLKVYVLNREVLDRETTSEEFAALYNEFHEFELLEEQFRAAAPAALSAMIAYADLHRDEFGIFS